MSGTVSGGHKAAATIKAKYGKNWFAEIGAIGGSHSTPGGFGSNRELAREAGRKGGLVSKRGRSLKTAERVRRAKLLHDKGATIKSIAFELSVSESTVSRYLDSN